MASGSWSGVLVLSFVTLVAFGCDMLSGAHKVGATRAVATASVVTPTEDTSESKVKLLVGDEQAPRFRMSELYLFDFDRNGVAVTVYPGNVRYAGGESFSKRVH